MPTSTVSFPLNSRPCAWVPHDRCTTAIKNDALTVAGGWLSTGAVPQNFVFEFDACAPATAPQVQIWAGFRHYSADYRYTVALRGGANSHLYLARLGAEGYDKMLALRPLEFLPMPGVWYHIKVVAAGARIAVYLNHEEQPTILVEDTAPTVGGGVCLGGSYLPTQFKNATLAEVGAAALDGAAARPDYAATLTPTPTEKEQQRRRNRAAYRPCCISALPDERLTVSLDGEWLFLPDYELEALPAAPQAMTCDDSAAHTIAVPSAWVPLRAWLEGEAMADMNKGMNDSYLVGETARCANQTFDYTRTESGWYRHYLDLPQGIEGKNTVLDFEGIALISTIYLNGVKIHSNIGMFAPQVIDISPYVHAGRNLLAVEVRRRYDETADAESRTAQPDTDANYAAAWNILDSGKGYTGSCERRAFCTEDIPHGFYEGKPGGIWRPVHLTITDALHIAECFFRPTLQDATVQVICQNTGGQPRTARLLYTLTHKATGALLCCGVGGEVSLAPGESQTITFTTEECAPQLWAPGCPNLYDLKLELAADDTVLDARHETVGFRTVAFEGATLLYSGAPLWVRGANHMPAHVHPNDSALAHAFMRQALAHNCLATRTHVAPWTDAWLDAADEEGLAISFEGTWTWLMLEHIPSERSIQIWLKELAALLKRHRNRPSLFLLAMNNEMKFYLQDATDEVVTAKGAILGEGIRLERALIPDLPLVCDSAYYRKHAQRTGRYGRIIAPCGYDDGDMDDPHGYFGWYNPDFYHFMNGEFAEEYVTPGRPCMSQECATGYPRAEDGLPTRAYLYMHQTPQTTVGKNAYEFCDPALFLRRHAMLTKELAEVLRRVEHAHTCGVMLFAFETWFYQQGDARRIQPGMAAKALRTAYQPVLASAALWGRHLFAGSTLTAPVTLINDANDHTTLTAPTIKVELLACGQTVAQTVMVYPTCPYFATRVQNLALKIPHTLPAPRAEAVLQLSVYDGEQFLSRNRYELLLCTAAWSCETLPTVPLRYLESNPAAADLLAAHGLPALPWRPGMPVDSNRLVVVGTVDAAQAEPLYQFAQAGGRVLLLGQKELPQGILGSVNATFTPHRQEIITMNRPESSIFAGLEPLDTAWFPDEHRVPYVAEGRYTVDRFAPEITVLAETLEWHGYIQKPTDYKQFGGTPLFAVKVGAGNILVSALRTDADAVDPVAARLTANILGWDFDAATL